ncbi:hypothetical protein N0V95_000595 [Ascochyta clinopodiicola]|nr:hypothetical protein N0V95_000595 [Ascochyta clinopodiicola]
MLFGLISAAISPLLQREPENLASRAAITHRQQPVTHLRPMAILPRSRGRRATNNVNGDPEDYKLSISETWYWGMNGSSVPIAKADCSFTRDGKQPWNGRIVALEKLMGGVENIQCSSSAITLQWSNKNSFNTAKTNWGWVNEESSRYLAMVVKSSGCAGGQRQTYKVSDIKTSKGNLTMSIDAKPVDFADAIPYIDFRLSTTGVSPAMTPRGLIKRAEATIPVARDFSGTNILNQTISDGLDVSLTCGNCKTTGNFDLDLEANFDAGAILQGNLPFSGSLSITAQQLSATIGLDLVVTAEITSAFENSITFLNVPLLQNPLSVAGIANIGPTLMVNLDANIDSITASVDLSLGSVTMSIPDGAKATLDLNGGTNSNSGFMPTFSTEGPTINAGISASASFGPNIVLGLEATIFNTGVAAGLALAAPQLSVTASIGTDQACAGVDFEADLTAQLNAFAGAGNVADVAAENTISIVGTSTQIFSTCLTVPTDAPATATVAPPAAQPTPFGGMVGAVLSDPGCQQALNNPGAVAPKLCAADGGDSSFTQSIDGSANTCCPGGTGDLGATLDGTTSTCCA